MSSTPSCIAGAARAIQAATPVRIPAAHRTFASINSSRASIPPRAIAGNTAHRIVQAEKNVLGVSRRINGAQEQMRMFSSSSQRHALKTIQQVRARNKSGPFNLTAAILFVATAGGLYTYFTYEKERMARQRIANQTKGVGKPKVGGPFDLVDHNGNRFTHEDLLGRYSLVCTTQHTGYAIAAVLHLMPPRLHDLQPRCPNANTTKVYFGFSHCPDICPDELDKMALMHDKVKEQCGDVMVPLMITCDPARDTPEVLKEYLAEFHPAILGLTGTYENIKQTCKEYRVYFSTPSTVKPGQDYLVDHSIYFYLMDPEGDFVEAIGRNFTAEQAARIISDHIKDWEKPLKKESRWS
ncbi:sco1 domain-containing protein [Paraphaeosphaeria sporulosa]